MLFLPLVLTLFSVAVCSDQTLKLPTSPDSVFSNKRRGSKEDPSYERSISPRENSSDPPLSYNALQERKSDVALTTNNPRLVLEVRNIVRKVSSPNRHLVFKIHQE